MPVVVVAAYCRRLMHFNMPDNAPAAHCHCCCYCVCCCCCADLGDDPLAKVKHVASSVHILFAFRGPT